MFAMDPPDRGKSETPSQASSTQADSADDYGIDGKFLATTPPKKNKGGRPRKHLTPEDAKAAIKASNKAWRQRRREAANKSPTETELQVVFDPRSTLARPTSASSTAGGISYGSSSRSVSSSVSPSIPALSLDDDAPRRPSVMKISTITSAMAAEDRQARIEAGRALLDLSKALKPESQ